MQETDANRSVEDLGKVTATTNINYVCQLARSSAYAGSNYPVVGRQAVQYPARLHPGLLQRPPGPRLRLHVQPRHPHRLHQLGRRKLPRRELFPDPLRPWLGLVQWAPPGRNRPLALDEHLRAPARPQRRRRPHDPPRPRHVRGRRRRDRLPAPQCRAPNPHRLAIQGVAELALPHRVPAAAGQAPLRRPQPRSPGRPCSARPSSTCIPVPRTRALSARIGSTKWTP